jgi:hypothetical protein
VADNLRLVHVKKQGDCDIYTLYVRGKQLAPGVDPTCEEAIAHGGTSDHASEADVAEKIFREVIVPKIERRKAEYAVVMKRISEKKYGAKVGSPEYQRLVSMEMEKLRRLSAEMQGPFVSDPDPTGYLPVEGFFDGFSSSDGESPQASATLTGYMRSPATPASALPDRDFSSESSGSEASDDSGSSQLMRNVPGMGTSSSCAHLPAELQVQQHIHKIFKTEQAGAYECGVCGGRGGGGMVYTCKEAACAGWCAHLNCVLDEDDHDMRSLLRPTAVTSTFTLPVLRSSSEAYGLRATLSMDGCNGQVKAAIKLIAEVFFPAGIDIIKGSAQCSPSQNPLDCMRSFMNIKRSKPTWTWSTATHASTEMVAWIDADFKKTMKNCSPTDINSFVLSFMHLEQTLSSCFTIKIVQGGWAKAGLIGLELHQIMSHWIGWKMLSAEQIQGIKDLLPAFFHEMSTTGILSDASMQSLQKYFDVDFHHYVVDRAALTTSRTRAQLLSVFQRELRQRTLDTICRDVALGADEEPRPDGAPKDAAGLCICPCGGRHYVDDDESWEKHINYKKHKCACD